MKSLRDALLADTTQALKRVLRRPSFTLIIGVTLGLALGASTLAFAVLYGYLFRPLPYAAPGQLLVPRQRLLKAGLLGPQVSVNFYNTLKNFPEFRSAGLFDIDSGTVTVRSSHTFEGFTAVTPSTFALLGVKPLLGRTLSGISGNRDGPREVVLSYSFWQSAFGGNANALGQTMKVSGTPMRVVGVMPRNFIFPNENTAFWLPFVITPRRARSHNINYMMIVRKPSGWNLARVNALLRGIRDRELSGETPSARARSKDDGYVIDAVPYRKFLLSYVGGSAPFWGLFGFALVLLLLGTLNATNFVVAHQRKRLGDLKLRQIVGAGRAAILRMTLIEYLPALLAIGGIAVGLTYYCIELLHFYKLPSAYVPFTIRFGAPTVTYFLAVLVIVTLCLTGSAVAASVLSQPSATTVQELAQRGSASRQFRNAQRLMVSTQIGLALVLIVCGVLLSQSLIALLKQPLHFRSKHVTVASVMLAKPTSVSQFWRRIHAGFRDLPGTQSTALSFMVPFGESREGGEFYPMGDLGKRTWVWVPMVSAAFFKTMGVNLVAGRPFGVADDQPGSHNVIVSTALARAFYGRTDVVGETLNGNRHIIGVVPTLPWRLNPSSDHNGYAVYMPISADHGHYVQVLVRSTADAAILTPAIRRVVAANDPDVTIHGIQTLPYIMQQASLNREALTGVAVGFGMLAFIIAVFGVYAMVDYSTRLRSFEFGIRQILGAQGGDILTLVLREISMLVLAGGAVGIAISYVAARGLHTLLYGVVMLDPPAYLGSLAVIAAAVFVAAALPVWRATRLDLAQIMRE